MKKSSQPIYLRKSMLKGMKSSNGKIKWKVGKWFKENDISICNKGFHASENPIHAMGFVNCGVLAKVEVRGKSIIQDDKQCWSEMRIVKAYQWTKEDSVSLAIFAAELVIDIYEKKYPKDDRPRKAIEAAKEWLKNPSAAAANAAKAAVYAAANAAYAAANAAANAAKAAANAANANAEIRNKCAAFVLKRIKAK